MEGRRALEGPTEYTHAHIRSGGLVVPVPYNPSLIRSGDQTPWGVRDRPLAFDIAQQCIEATATTASH